MKEDSHDLCRSREVVALLYHRARLHHDTAVKAGRLRRGISGGLGRDYRLVDLDRTCRGLYLDLGRRGRVVAGGCRNPGHLGTMEYMYRHWLCSLLLVEVEVHHQLVGHQV